MPSFNKLDDIIDYFFDWSLQDDEWELHIALVLLSYMTGYIRKWRKSRWIWIGLEKEELMIFNRLIPKWWGIQKTYIYLFIFFWNENIKPKVVFHKDIFLKYNKLSSDYDITNEYFDKFYNKGEVDQIFQNPYFFQLWPDILEFIEIENNFDTDENIEKIQSIVDSHIDDFVKGEISKRHKLLPYEQQRNKLFNKFSDYYSLIWNSFRIKESQLNQYKDISILYTMALLWKLDYIHIYDFHTLDDMPEFDEKGRYKNEKEDPNFHIYITEKARVLFEWLFEVKNLLLDKIFDEEYKKISIIRKWKDLHMLEWEKEVLGDEARFVELQKKYPHSEIKAKNYKGKVAKYEISEKIKL